jgi:VRR-NUC domain
MTTKLERDWQRNLIEELRTMFPGAYIQKNNPNKQQGIPDLLILWNERWAVLEVKKSINEPYQPNQEYFIATFNAMSFSAMICPENEKEVLDALQSALRA